MTKHQSEVRRLTDMLELENLYKEAKRNERELARRVRALVKRASKEQDWPAFSPQTIGKISQATTAEDFKDIIDRDEW